MEIYDPLKYCNLIIKDVYKIIVRCITRDNWFTHIKESKMGVSNLESSIRFHFSCRVGKRLYRLRNLIMKTSAKVSVAIDHVTYTLNKAP